MKAAQISGRGANRPKTSVPSSTSLSCTDRWGDQNRRDCSSMEKSMHRPFEITVVWNSRVASVFLISFETRSTSPSKMNWNVGCICSADELNSPSACSRLSCDKIGSKQESFSHGRFELAEGTVSGVGHCEGICRTSPALGSATLTESRTWSWQSIQV
jgi:hypothetical protein